MSYEGASSVDNSLRLSASQMSFVCPERTEGLLAEAEAAQRRRVHRSARPAILIVSSGRSEITGRLPHRAFDGAWRADALREEQRAQPRHVRSGHRGALHRDVGVAVEPRPNHRVRREVARLQDPPARSWRRVPACCRRPARRFPGARRCWSRSRASAAGQRRPPIPRPRTPARRPPDTQRDCPAAPGCRSRSPRTRRGSPRTGALHRVIGDCAGPPRLRLITWAPLSAA